MSGQKRSTKFLIVDDFPTMRKFVVTMLKQIGCAAIVEADSLEKALRLLKSEKDVGCIITACNMPEDTGLELLKAVRIDAKQAHTSVIVIASEVERDTVQKATKDDSRAAFLIKPFTSRVFKEKVDKVLGPVKSNNKQAS